MTNLFEYLKYCSTNLGSSEELMRLPNDVLIQYYIRAMNLKSTVVGLKHRKCLVLSKMYNETESFREPFRNIFKECLRTFID